LNLQLDLGRPSRAKPNQANSIGSLQKHPKPCDWGDCRAAYIRIEAKMDSFAKVPTVS
jgi:hypothetical protein